MSIALPQSAMSGSMSVEEAIRARRTCREYSGAPLSLDELSQLLSAAQGSTGEGELRAAPSAGGHYPLQIYVAAGMVSHLPVGLHHYQGKNHTLKQITHDDLRPSLRAAALDDQPWVAAAAVLMVMADVAGMQEHFHNQPPGQRGARYAYIEAGAVAENVHLQATALGLALVLVAGFKDEEVKALLPDGGNLEPIVMLCVGAGQQR